MHIILKEYDKMRPLKEISKELSLNPKTVMKQAWILNKTLKTKEDKPKTKSIQTKSSVINTERDLHQKTSHFPYQRQTATDYLHQSAGKMTKNKELIVKAENILKQIKRSGGNPIGLASGAFYYSCKKTTKISKEKIGHAFGISPRTVYSNEARIRKLLPKIRKLGTRTEIAN